VDTRARARMIALHTPYVHKLVGMYRGIGLSPYDLDDLAQEGLVGLIEAVDAFRSSILPVNRFRSYARHQILGRIRQSLRAILNVRDNETTVGHDVPECVETIDRADFADELWSAIRRLSPFEAWVVIESAGMDGRSPRSLREMARDCGLPASRIRTIRITAHRRLAERLTARRRA
jgi:RNA polymerase sigma factor (sigma-70 family)